MSETIFKNAIFSFIADTNPQARANGKSQYLSRDLDSKGGKYIVQCVNGRCFMVQVYYGDKPISKSQALETLKSVLPPDAPPLTKVDSSQLKSGKDKDRDKDKNRDRERSRERNTDSYRSRDTDSYRSRDTDRDRDKDTNKDKEAVEIYQYGDRYGGALTYADKTSSHVKMVTGSTFNAEELATWFGIPIPTSTDETKTKS